MIEYGFESTQSVEAGVPRIDPTSVKPAVTTPYPPKSLGRGAEYGHEMRFGSNPGWFNLGNDELVWESRPHPFEMGVGFPAGIAIAIAAIAVGWWAGSDDQLVLAAVALLIALVAGGFVVVRYLVWTNTRYVITTGELYKKRGIVSRDVTQFRLDRIQNTSLEQTAVGRILGYGNLTIYTAGSGDPELTFERVPRPERASSLLSDQLSRGDSESTTEQSTSA